MQSLAFYLPQFHPFAENDEWWGKGFTEWTNVSKAKPLFEGHQQPRLPADLGFYDLRLAETRAAQAALAKEFGIDGFVYYHYWFNGRQVMDRPVNDLLNSDDTDFPFALCWANEDWRRNWDGRSGEVLLEQHYSEEDDRAHIEWLLKAFKDRRYIKVDGNPLFLVYRVALLPNPARTAEIWREVAREAGLGEIFLCHVEGMERLGSTPEEIGFDAAVEFAPDWECLGMTKHNGELTLSDYPSLTEKMFQKPTPNYRRFPCVTPGFDNSPRKGETGFINTDVTPDAFGSWVEKTISREVKEHPNESQIVFVNAWNEWAEGAILEPCQLWGKAFGQAHAGAKERALQSQTPLISVALLADGGAQAMIDCLQSAVNTQQNYNVQFIAVDNATTDETAYVLSQLKASIKSVRNDDLKTAETAWRQAALLADGEFTVFVSTDYRFESGWIEKLFAHFDYNPTVALQSPVGVRSSQAKVPGWVEANIAQLTGYIQPALEPSIQS